MFDFSRTYYPSLTDEQHKANNKWFEDTLSDLRNKNIKGLKITEIPDGPKYFSSISGEEVNEDGTPLKKYNYVIGNAITGEFIGYD